MAHFPSPAADYGFAATAEWVVAEAPVPYAQAVSSMDAHVAAMAEGAADERIWLLEHPPVITAGTATRPEEWPSGSGIPVIATGRGGRLTYHGPGQRVVYVMLDLARRGRDVRQLVSRLEHWGIAALAELGIPAFTSPIGTGIWVEGNQGPAKIGAIGIRIRRWISYHGLSLNVAPDPSAFDSFTPCGIAERGITRIIDHVPSADMALLDRALWATRHQLLSLGSATPPGTPALEGARQSG